MKKLANIPFETRSMSDYEAYEKRNQLLENMETMLNATRTEKRSFSATEAAQYNNYKRQIEAIDRASAETSFDGLTQVGGNADEKRMLLEEQTKNFMAYVQKGEMRNLTAAASGGAVVPTEISQMIVDKIVNSSPLVQLCNRITTNADISVPVFDFTALSAGYITENVDMTEASPNFAQVKLTNYIIAGIVKCSRSLVNRADINVLEFLTTSIAKRLGYFLEREMILGTGTNALRGLTTLAAGQTNTGAAIGAIGGDELIDLLAKLPASLQENAIFLMNPVTWANIQKLKSTGSGDYLFNVGGFGQNFGPSLLGKRVHVSDSVPVQATGTKFIYALDPQAVTLKMTTDVGVQILDQTFAASYNYGLMGFVECDSAITTTQGVVALVGK